MTMTSTAARGNNGCRGCWPLASVMMVTAVLYVSMAPAALVVGEESVDKSGTIDPDIKDLLGGGGGSDSEASSSAAKADGVSPVPPSKDADGGDDNKDDNDGLLDLMDHGDEEDDKKEEDDDGTSASDSGEKKASNTSAVPDTPEAVFLPEEGAAEKEHSNSLAIFFVLSVLILCIFLVHFILRLKCHLLPESVVIIFLGAVIGLFMRLLPSEDMKSVEAFSPSMFFLVLLPPIIFESGYNLHKGNFFANLGSILLFAILGTIISALVVGGGVYLLGLADVVYRLNFVQSFAFGSLISAVDPVATLAIFQALDIDPVLNMLVFGESILNDAVAIVLTTTVLESNSPEMAELSTMQQVWHGIGRFLVIFLGSAGIGTVVGLTSSLMLKHVDLYHNPSLEFGLMLCFVYSPYALAEGTHLSGIMSILFCGIVMSQYTHYNLSPVTQITMQQTMRTLAFICESCVFAYLGLAIFSFPHQLEIALIVWSIIFILIGRAFNIFPLAAVCNRFRQHQITKKMMLIMWFSGLRGAIAYALSLHLEFKEETRKVLVTTTLVVVLFTTIGLGGSTMPFMKYLESQQPASARRNRRGRRKKEITMSKTRELGATIDSEHLSELTEEEMTEAEMGAFSIDDVGVRATGRFKGFLYYDLKYLRPLLTRKFTQRELKEGQNHVTKLTDKWIHDLQGGGTSPLVLTDSEGEFSQQQD